MPGVMWVEGGEESAEPRGSSSGESPLYDAVGQTSVLHMCHSRRMYATQTAR